MSRGFSERVWQLLEGWDAHAMAGSKIPRIENAMWHDPVATFTIERHGHLAGEIQAWSVDLASGTAACVYERSLLPPNGLSMNALWPKSSRALSGRAKMIRGCAG